MIVRIRPAVLQQIRDDVATTPQLERCGLLFGSEVQIERAEPAANVAARPECFFEIDPAALFAALRAERAGGPRLIGHYHSHPSGSAEPSARDLVAAEPGKLWLIVGGDDVRLWMAVPGAFTEAKLEAI